MAAAISSSSVVGELARAELARWVAMDPAAWAAYMASTEGRTALRRVSAATMLEQIAQASADGSASGATRAVGLLAKLTDTLRAPDVAEDPEAALRDLPALLDALSGAVVMFRDLAGRDAVLKVIGLREVHVAELPSTGSTAAPAAQ